jgi:hypothetical protein
VKKRRHLIKSWYRQGVSKVDRECAHCGQTIYAYSLFERDVYREGRKLVVENRHLRPVCPDRYYE